MIVLLVLIFSALLQIAAAIMAFRLIPLTGKRTAWSLIAIALMLMALRRCIPLIHMFLGDAMIRPDLSAELVAFLISLLMVVGIANISSIFTESKRSEKALLKNEQQYRFLTENIRDVIWVMDVETMQFLYVSPSVEKLRGYTPEEVLAYPVTAALTAEAAEYVTRLTQSRAADLLSGKALSDRFYAEYIEQPCKDGSTVWTEVVSSFYVNQDNGRVEVRGVTRDVTERKKVEDELRKSEVKYRLLFNSMRDAAAVHWIGVDGWPTNYIEANDNFCKMLGYTREEMLQLSPLNVDIMGRSEPLFATVQKFLQEKQILFETGQIAKDGRMIPAEVSLSLFELEGRPAAVAIIRDITERKQAESQREAALDEIRKLNETLEDKINTRTAELQETVAQLEELNRVFVGRELKMIELKARIAELEKKT